MAQEKRTLECTECSLSIEEIGDPIHERPGDVIMRRCEQCGAPTVHLVLSKKRVKQEKESA